MEQGVRGRSMSDYGINHIEVDKLVKFCKEAKESEDLRLLKLIHRIAENLLGTVKER